MGSNSSVSKRLSGCFTRAASLLAGPSWCPRGDPGCPARGRRGWPPRGTWATRYRPAGFRRPRMSWGSGAAPPAAAGPWVAAVGGVPWGRGASARLGGGAKPPRETGSVRACARPCAWVWSGSRYKAVCGRKKKKKKEQFSFQLFFFFFFPFPKH